MPEPHLEEDTHNPAPSGDIPHRAASHREPSDAERSPQWGDSPAVTWQPRIDPFDSAAPSAPLHATLWGPLDSAHDEGRARTRSQPQAIITYGGEDGAAAREHSLSHARGYDHRGLMPPLSPFRSDIWGQPVSPARSEGDDGSHGGEDAEAALINGRTDARAHWDLLTPSPPAPSSLPSTFGFLTAPRPGLGGGHSFDQSSLFSYTQPALGGDALRSSVARRVFDDEDDLDAAPPSVIIHSAPFLSPLSSAVRLEELQQRYDHLLSDGDEADDGVVVEAKRRCGASDDLVPPSPAQFFPLHPSSVGWTRPMTIIDDKDGGDDGGRRQSRIAHPTPSGGPSSDLSVAARPFYPSS